MNRIGKSRSSLILIELILAIAFFALGSSICIRVFAQAALMSRSAADLSFASSQVSSAATVIRCSTDPIASAENFFPQSYKDGNLLYMYYNQDRQPCRKDGAVYTMTVCMKNKEEIWYSHICMTDKDKNTIYELDIRYPSSKEKGDP